jgi:trehalose 6-phosphate phosphatase
LIYFFDITAQETFSNLLVNRTVLAFDFDGTLAPIVNHRDDAVMRGTTKELFVQVCERYSCAIVTGRSISDVSHRLDSAKIWKIIGHHGLETGTSTKERAPEIAKAAIYLRQVLKNEPGIELEDKGLSLAIHYRGAPQPSRAFDVISSAIVNLPPEMRRIDGKAVVNLVPHYAPNKGDAILDLRQEAGATNVLYVGDDITDEDVFELRQPDWLMTVRVGSSQNSSARFFLRDQTEIDHLLEKLLSRPVNHSHS